MSVLLAREPAAGAMAMAGQERERDNSKSWAAVLAPSCLAKSFRYTSSGAERRVYSSVAQSSPERAPPTSSRVRDQSHTVRVRQEKEKEIREFERLRVA